ncbi:MAG: BON domain-containing protein [Nitrosopumilus sp.]|nr:BON domain-containing protein [Nitrosopumilus sp.]
MKKLFTIIILGSTALVSADHYYQQPSCRSGNCQAREGQNQSRFNSQENFRSDRYVPRYSQDGQNSNQDRNDRRDGQNFRNDRDSQNFRNDRDSQNFRNDRDSQNFRNDRFDRNESNNNDYNDGDNNDGDDSATSDLAIFKQTQKTISSGMFSRAFDNVFFEVDNGHVTLRGTVDTADNKAKAEESIKGIEGVKGVTNKITTSDSIRGDASRTGNSRDYSNTANASRTGASQDFAATAEDKQLNDVIRNRLRQWLSTKNVDTLVIKNKNGEVVIIGTVDRQEDIKKADDQVKAIQGVRRLENRLTVENTANRGNTANTGTNVSTMPQDSALTPKDKELNSRIRERLGSWLSSRNVEGMMIKTKNGEVVVIGTVDKPEDIEKVNYQLKNIEGITKVDNQLKVKN